MITNFDFQHGLHASQISQLTESPRTILEIGASFGEDTNKMLATLDKNDRIFCIEADYRALEKHKNNVKDKRVNLIHAAITDVDGEGIFHLCTSTYKDYGPWDLASSLKKIKHGLVVNPWLKYEEDVIVKYIKLDTFCKNNKIDNIDFIWCDVEGNYSEVVEGGKNILKRTKFFYTECEDVETYEGEIMYPAIKEKMEKLNWQLVYRFRYDALFKNKSL